MHPGHHVPPPTVSAACEIAARELEIVAEADRASRCGLADCSGMRANTSLFRAPVDA